MSIVINYLCLKKKKNHVAGKKWKQTIINDVFANVKRMYIMHNTFFNAIIRLCNAPYKALCDLINNCNHSYNSCF